MEDIVDLLKSALEEESEEKRIQYIVKGCKKITDLLPFDYKIPILCKAELLPRYLIMNFIFSQNSIKMIMQSLLTKLCDNDKFIENMWKALSYISKLMESDYLDYMQNSTKREQPMSFSKKKQKNYLQKIQESIIPTTEYCYAVQEQILDIKQVALNLMTFMYDNKRQLYNKQQIFVDFLQHSFNEKFLLDVQNILSKVNENHQDEFINITFFNDQIEEIIRQKRKVGLFKLPKAPISSSVQKKHSQNDQRARADSFTSVNFSENSSSIHSEEEEEEIDEIGNISPRKKKKIQNGKVKDSDHELQVGEQLDQWFLFNEDINIGRSDYMMSFFKVEENLLLVMSYIFDPLLHHINLDLWLEVYPELEEDNTKALQNKTIFKGYTGDVDIIHLNCTLKRSKILQERLSHAQNIRTILNCSQHFYTQVIGMAYDFFSNRQIWGNINHVARFIDCLLMLLPESALHNMMNNNLLFLMIDNIHNMIVYDILIGLLSTSQNKYKISQQTHSLLMKYLHTSNLFREMCNLALSSDFCNMYTRTKMYTNDDIQKIIVKLQDSSKKNDKKFSSKMSPEQIKLAEEQQEMDRKMLDVRVGTFKPIQQVDQEYLFVRELSGSGNDIQNFEQFCKTKALKKHEYMIKMQQEEQLKRQEQLKQQQEMKKKQYEEIQRNSVFGRKNSTARKSIRESSIKGLNQSQDITPVNRKGSQLSMQGQGRFSISSNIFLNQRRDSQSSINNSNTDRRQSGIGFPTRIRYKDKFALSKPFDEIKKELKLKYEQEPVPETFLKMQKFTQRLQLMGIIKIDDETYKNRFAVQHKNIEQNKLFQQFNETFEKKTLTSSKLKQIYPQNLAYVGQNMQSLLESMTRQPQFFSEQVLNKESISYPISQIIYEIVKDCIGFEVNNEIYNVCTGNYLDQDTRRQTFAMLFDNGSEIFDKLLTNYLVKFRILAQLKGLNHSSIICGHIINLILNQFEEISLIYPKTAESIREVCKQSLEFASKTVKNIYKQIKFNFYLQSVKVTSPVGTDRILLMNTIIHIIEMHKKDKNSNMLFNTISDQVWHVFLIWFLDNVTNNIYHLLFTKLMNLTLNFGNERVILLILFKLGLIASMVNAEELLKKNNIQMNQWNIDSFQIAMQKIAVSIFWLKQSNKYPNINNYLDHTESWIKLQEKIILDQKKQNTTTSNIILKNLKSTKQISQTPMNYGKLTSNSILGDNLKNKTSLRKSFQIKRQNSSGLKKLQMTRIHTESDNTNQDYLNNNKSIQSNSSALISDSGARTQTMPEIDAKDFNKQHKSKNYKIRKITNKSNSKNKISKTKL